MDYSQFFSAALGRLHDERRYRVFADLERIAGRFPHAVSLKRIKGDPVLADWDLARLPRLSVMPVSEAQWQRVLELSRESTD